MPVTRVLLALPLDSERERIATRRARFAEALTLAGGELDAWLHERWVQRAVTGGGRVSFGELRLADPALAWAAARWLREHDHELPPEIARAPEAYFPLTEDDWRLLLGDYARHARASATRSAVVDAAAELADPVAPVLRASAVKPALVCDALAAEDEGRHGALRAAVLADGAQADAVRAAIAADERLTGCDVRIGPDPGDAEVLVDLRGDGAAQTLWRIVCVDPALSGGGPDYAAFAAQVGDPATIDPALTVSGAPPAQRFTEINLRQLDAATGGALGAPAARGPSEPPRPQLSTREKARILRQAFGVFGWMDGWSVKLGLLVVALLVGAVLFDTAVLGVPAAVLAPVWVIGMILRSSSRRRRGRYPVELPIDWAAAVVLEAYAALGEVAPGATFAFATDADGRARLRLPGATEAQRARVTAAVGTLTDPGGVPRWVVSRPVETGVAGHGRRAWYPVPEDFTARPERRAAFTAAWRRWTGPGWLLEARAADLEDDETAHLLALAQQPGGIDDGTPELGELADDDSDLPTLPERPRLLEDPVELT
jgi:hypothetical protein